MFYHANGKLEINKEIEHFSINQIGYRDNKFIKDDKSDPLYKKYYKEDKTEQKEDKTEQK